MPEPKYQKPHKNQPKLVCQSPQKAPPLINPTPKTNQITKAIKKATHSESPYPHLLNKQKTPSKQNQSFNSFLPLHQN